MKNSSLVLALLLFSVSFCLSAQNDELTVKVSVEKSQASVSGELESANSIKLSPPRVQGLWRMNISFMAADGKPIMPGMPVIKFDGKQLMDKLREKQSALNTAKKEFESKLLEDERKLEQLKLDLAEAEMNLEKARRKTEFRDPNIASRDFAKYELDLKLAQETLSIKQQLLDLQVTAQASRKKLEQNKIARLQIEVDEMQSDLEKLDVKADRPGFVLHLTNHSGKKISVNDSVWPQQKIVEIADLKQMQVKAVIDEPLARKVRVGQAVNFKLDAFPDKIYSGQIKSLGNAFRAFTRKQPKVVFDAIISIDDVDPKVMRPGMNARINLVFDDEKQGIFIPEAYVKQDNGTARVLVRSWWNPEPRAVVLGSQYQDKVEVISGLEQGEVIVKP